VNIGVLASHEGTTLQALLDACADGRIQGRVAVVVSNNGDAGALKRARRAKVQAVHLSSKTHEDPVALDAAIHGDRVFEAVLKAGEAESGVSIHLVDADYDSGAIVRQCRVPVFRDDLLEELKARIRAREKEFVVVDHTSIDTAHQRPLNRGRKRPAGRVTGYSSQGFLRIASTHSESAASSESPQPNGRNGAVFWFTSRSACA